MKQADDLFTLELPEMDTTPVRDSLTIQHTKTNYRFYIRTHSAQTEWCGLSRKQARDMYAYTNAHQPSNVIAYGWEEQA